MTMKPLSLLLFISAFSLNAADFSSSFKNTYDRVWLGEHYWANPMEDWRIRDGLAVCLSNGPNRNVHLLTHGLKEDPAEASFSISVRLGIEPGPSKKGSAGFLIGVMDSETRDPQASLLTGKGLVAGVRADGKLFIGKAVSEKTVPSLRDLVLSLDASPSKS